MARMCYNGAYPLQVRQVEAPAPRQLARVGASMGDTLYRVLRILGSPFRYSVGGTEHVRHDGPAVFVANHCANLGPVAIMLSVPLRFYPWVKADLLDPVRSPGHLYREFAQPSLHLDRGPGMLLAHMISWITVPLLGRLGCVAVESQGYWTGRAFRESLALLSQNRNLLVFPEDPLEPADPETTLHPFKVGFVELARIHQRATARELPLYPLAVNAHSKRITIAEPVFYHDEANWREHMHRVSAEMHDTIARMVLASAP